MEKHLRFRPFLTKQSAVHAARSAVATTASLLVARLCTMPEPYWACITTMIVMQSTLGASWKVSKGRIIGTAIGAIFGAVMATWLKTDAVVFGLAIFALGLICAAVRLEGNAYRFAGIAVAIVTLTSHSTVPPYVIAFQRFAEVSIGIVTALILSALWTEPSDEQRISLW